MNATKNELEQIKQHAHTTDVDSCNYTQIAYLQWQHFLGECDVRLENLIWCALQMKMTCHVLIKDEFEEDDAL